MYRVTMTQAELEALPWWSEVAYPRADTQVTFGNGNKTLGNCSSGRTMSQADDHEKLGWDGNDDTLLYIKTSAGVYEFLFEGLPAGEEIGPPIDVNVRVKSCTTGAQIGEALVSYGPWHITDLDGREIPRADFVPSGGYSQGSPCSRGWEDNTGIGDGDLAYPTRTDPLNRGEAFNRGDLVPWDWERHPNTEIGFELSNRDEFLRRLAPNIVAPDGKSIDLSIVPDFKVGPYFENKPSGGRLALRPEYADTPPIASASSTPLGGMLNSLRDWYVKWRPVAVDPTIGDKSFECRARFAILLTDGAETCGGNPVSAAGALRDAGISTFVIGFGSSISAGSLQGIADQGGTGQLNFIDDAHSKDCESFEYEEDVSGVPVKQNICPGPIIASTRDKLKEVLLAIFTSFTSPKASFGGASVPMGQVDARESIFLPSFAPIEGVDAWQGELAMWKRPVQFKLDEHNRYVPDYSLTTQCPSSAATADQATGCWAWEAGAVNEALGVTWDEVAVGEFNLGINSGERRVFWSYDPLDRELPEERAWLEPEPDSTRHDDPEVAQIELWNRLGISYDVTDPLNDTQAINEATALVGTALALREGEDAEGIDQEYLLGDFFHSRPVFLGPPARFEYMVNNLYGDGDCWNGDQFQDQNKGYRCFWLKHRWRRQTVIAGSNDGMVHVFDAGRVKHKGSSVKSPADFRFTLGTGAELFSFMPRAIVESLEDRAKATDHMWGVDGEIARDDVFVDPDFTAALGPNPDKREWRTLAIGGLRRGGRGYWALDLTNPDPVTKHQDYLEMVPPDNAPEVPKCLDGAGSVGCGGLAYPAIRWEFADLHPETGDPLDEDANDQPDLTYSWSRPSIGRIKTSEGDKFVAVFGGGIDPENEGAGNFIYMVDTETGLPIYKRAVAGAVPTEPALIDSNGNGYLDRAYFGDTSGALYKIDMSTAGTIVDVVIDDTVSPPITQRRIDEKEWEVYSIFETGGRPIFFPPSALWVGTRGKYAVAFGTGDREDLWSPQPESGRFYVFLDQDLMPDTLGLPFDDSALEAINTRRRCVYGYSATHGRGTDSRLLPFPAPGRAPHLSTVCHLRHHRLLDLRAW